MLSTARLLLRPFTLGDVPKVFAMGDEEGIRRWIPDQVYRDQQHAELVVRYLIAHTDNDPDPRAKPYVLGIEHKESADLIGHVGLSPARGSVEIGYAIEQRRHGHGYATEAVSAISTWATVELSLPEVLGIVESDNTPSCRVLEKAGYVRHGVEVKEATGRAATIVVYRHAPESRSR
jgi:RimJ/RimL family protein N-acetyltransferase